MSSRYTNKNGVKLLAAIFAFAMIACAAVAFVPSEDVDAAAVDLPAAKNGVVTLGSASYKLSENVDAKIVVPEGVTATLDLAGKTISVTGVADSYKEDNSSPSGAVIWVKGALTINDSVGNGSVVQNGGSSVAAVHVSPSGSLIINDGNYKNTSSNAYYTLKNLGTVTINNGTFNNKSIGAGDKTTGSSVIANGYFYGDAALLKNLNTPDAVMTIKGGQFTGYQYVKNDDLGFMYIYGGTFSGTPRGGAIMNAGTLVIDDDADSTQKLQINKEADTDCAVINFVGNSEEDNNVDGRILNPAKLTIVSGSFDVGALFSPAKDRNYFGDVTIASGLKKTILSVASETLNGKLKIGDNAIVFSDVTATNLVITEGSIAIKGHFTTDSSGTITVTGVARLTGDVTINSVNLIIDEGAELIVPEGKTLTVNGTMTVDGSLTNNGEVDGSGTVENNGTMSGNAISTTTVTYHDGTQMIIGDNLYNIFVTTITLSNGAKVDFAYGVTIPGINYNGISITMTNIEPEVIPLALYNNGTTDPASITDASYSANFSAPLSSVQDNDGSAGTVIATVAVNLNISSDEGSASKYVYKGVGFTIAPISYTVDVTIERWNQDAWDPTVNQPVVTVKDIDGNIVSIPSENIIATYSGTGLPSSFVQGDYTVTVTIVSADPNYKNTTSDIVGFTVGAPEMLPSKLVFSDITEEEATSLGINISDFQSNVLYQIGAYTSTGTGDARTFSTDVTVTGKVFKVMNAISAETTGLTVGKYYLIFSVNDTYETYTLISTVFSAATVITILDDGTAEGHRIILALDLGNGDAPADMSFAVDFDGVTNKYGTTTFNFDVSKMNMYIIKLIDSENDVLEYSEIAGEKFYMPSGRGLGFTNWILTDSDLVIKTIDGKEQIFKAGSVMIIAEKYADEHGQITLNAVYGTTPAPTPVDPSEDYVVSTSVVDDKVVVSVISLDGGYLVAGTEVTVTFTALEETTAFGQTVYKPTPVTETITISDDKPTTSNNAYELADILGDKYAVINVVSTIGTTGYGNMSLNYKE